MNITGWIKEHPMGTAAVVGVVAVAVFFLMRGSGNAAPSQQATDVATDLATQQLNAQTGIAMAQIAAQNATTAAAAGVQNNQTQAALQATLAQTDILKQAIAANADYKKASLDEYSTLATTAFSNIKNIGGSQNRLALIQSILGQPGAAQTTEASYAAVNNPAYGAGAVAASIAGTASKTLLGLFG
jgi:hypothetical protein